MTQAQMLPSIPARRNPGPPPISPRPVQYKLPPPQCTSVGGGEPTADRQTIRGFVDDRPKDAAPAIAPKESVAAAAVVVQQQPQQAATQPLQQPQLRTRRFKVPPPIKCISEPLDRGSRESYELMTPAAIMSPNRQVSRHRCLPSYSPNDFLSSAIGSMQICSFETLGKSADSPATNVATIHGKNSLRCLVRCSRNSEARKMFRKLRYARAFIDYFVL